MNLTEISARVRRNLNDEGITYYNPPDIWNSIQDGYEEIAVYCECIEKETELDFQSNLTYYDFSMLIPDYYRIIRIHTFNTNQFLGISDDRDFLSYRADWELIENTTREALILGPRFVGLTGRSSNATGSMRIWYKAQANKLTLGTDIPKINTSYQILLEHYATADLLEQNQEFSKAQRYWALYDPLLEKYRLKVQLLSKADRIFTRDETGIYYGHR